MAAINVVFGSVIAKQTQGKESQWCMGEIRKAQGFAR
jgi:hypothetical protein